MQLLPTKVPTGSFKDVPDFTGQFRGPGGLALEIDPNAFTSSLEKHVVFPRTHVCLIAVDPRTGRKSKTLGILLLAIFSWSWLPGGIG